MCRISNIKEKLYSIVEPCMPYIGYTHNAVNIIDEVSRTMENQSLSAAANIERQRTLKIHIRFSKNVLTDSNNRKL